MFCLNYKIFLFYLLINFIKKKIYAAINDINIFNEKNYINNFNKTLMPFIYKEFSNDISNEILVKLISEEMRQINMIETINNRTDKAVWSAKFRPRTIRSKLRKIIRYIFMFKI